MSFEKVETLVIGAGQAGVAMSEHLGKRGLPHLVVERDRVAERWRSERWDSLVANGPAWHDRFASKTFDQIEKEFFEHVRPTSLLKRFITPEEVGSFVAYIASPLASATSGAALRVDGGVVKSAF